MSRKELHPALAGGKVDMVAAMVTVRPELEKVVASKEPTRTNVSEVVVTGPGAPPIVVLTSDADSVAPSAGAEPRLESRNSSARSDRAADLRRRVVHIRTTRGADMVFRYAPERIEPAGVPGTFRSERGASARPRLSWPRRLHRQSIGALTGRAAFPSHGLRSRSRLAAALLALPQRSSPLVMGETDARQADHRPLAFVTGTVPHRLGAHRRAARPARA